MKESRSHDVYVAASWTQIDKAKEAADALREAGYAVWCFWEQGRGPVVPLIEALRGYDYEHPLWAKAWGKLEEVKMDDLLAIRDSLCVVLVEPAGNDAHFEAGFALGHDVPVVRYGDGKAGLMTFDALVARTPDELVRAVAMRLGKPAGERGLVRTGQGDYAKDR